MSSETRELQLDEVELKSEERKTPVPVGELEVLIRSMTVSQVSPEEDGPGHYLVAASVHWQERESCKYFISTHAVFIPNVPGRATAQSIAETKIKEFWSNKNDPIKSNDKIYYSIIKLPFR